MIKGELRPSFIYRAVIDKIVSDGIDTSNLIFLAPANNFGYSVYEQELAFNYLGEKIDTNTVHLIESPSQQSRYLDTYDNGRYLKNYLMSNSLDVSTPIIIYSGKYHIKRAALNFKNLGFNILRTVPVSYEIPNDDERIVSRLFYYNYPFLHKIYEYLAYWRDKFIY